MWWCVIRVFCLGPDASARVQSTGRLVAWLSCCWWCHSCCSCQAQPPGIWKYEGHKNQCPDHSCPNTRSEHFFFCFCFDMSRLWVGNSAMLQGTPTPSNYVALRSTIRQRIQGKNWWELNQAEHFEGRSKASTSESAPTSWSFKDLKSRNVRLCLACVLLQVRVYWVSGHPGIPIVCGATITKCRCNKNYIIL